MIFMISKINSHGKIAVAVYFCKKGVGLLGEHGHLPDKGDEVIVLHLFFLVGENKEVLVDLVEFLFVGLVAEQFESVL